MASTHETVAVLRDLIHTGRERAGEYRNAAGDVDDEEVRALLARYAERRERFVGELETELRRLGEDPRDMRTLGEALESAWTSIRGALASNDREGAVDALERGERELAETWRSALEAPLPGPIHRIVARQHEEMLRPPAPI